MKGRRLGRTSEGLRGGPRTTGAFSQSCAWVSAQKAPSIRLPKPPSQAVRAARYLADAEESRQVVEETMPDQASSYLKPTDS